MSVGFNVYLFMSGGALPDVWLLVIEMSLTRSCLSPGSSGCQSHDVIEAPKWKHCSWTYSKQKTDGPSRQICTGTGKVVVVKLRQRYLSDAVGDGQRY